MADPGILSLRFGLGSDQGPLSLQAIGQRWGVSKERIRREIDRIRATVISPSKEVNRYLTRRGSPPLTNGVRLDQLLKRGELDYGVVETLAASDDPGDERVDRQVEIEIKYEGYIRRQLRDIERFRQMEGVKIPDGFDFSRVHGLSNELKEKLSRIQPASLGQASRIDGITPAALSVLGIALKVFRGRRKTVFQGNTP
ncbi:MAG TPA: hypothetical protein EYP77_02960 [Anaerolineae bacterium]|nr:hypothetical protein [Anaerolineae bacterium]